MSAAVSVVVPYYRAQADLDRLTAALAAQRGLTGGLQLVVADDGSPVPPRVDPGLPFDVVTVRQPDRGFRASAARARAPISSRASTQSGRWQIYAQLRTEAMRPCSVSMSPCGW